MAESYPNGWKTLWEKEKLLVTSNSSFSHSVFKMLISQKLQKVSLSGNGLKVEKILGKGEKNWSPAFSPFLTLFSKGLSWGCQKSSDAKLNVIQNSICLEG